MQAFLRLCAPGIASLQAVALDAARQGAAYRLHVARTVEALGSAIAGKVR